MKNWQIFITSMHSFIIYAKAYYLLKVKARGIIWLRTILFDNRSSRTQNRVKAAIWARPSFLWRFLYQFLLCAFRPLSARNATENDITFDMRHVACDATRLLEAKFSDGMCREAGPDSYAKGRGRKGKTPTVRWQMTNPSRIEPWSGNDIATFRGRGATVTGDDFRRTFALNASHVV